MYGDAFAAVELPSVYAVAAAGRVAELQPVVARESRFGDDEVDIQRLGRGQGGVAVLRLHIDGGGVQDAHLGAFACRDASVGRDDREVDLECRVGDREREGCDVETKRTARFGFVAYRVGDFHTLVQGYISVAQSQVDLPEAVRNDEKAMIRRGVSLLDGEDHFEGHIRRMDISGVVGDIDTYFRTVFRSGGRRFGFLTGTRQNEREAQQRNKNFSFHGGWIFA